MSAESPRPRPGSIPTSVRIVLACMLVGGLGAAGLVLGGKVRRPPEPLREPPLLAPDSRLIEALVEGDDAGKLRALIENGANPRELVELPGIHAMTPLMAASQYGREASVEVLLPVAGGPERAVIKHDRPWPPHGWTALCFARWKRHSRVAWKLMAAGAEARNPCVFEADFLAAVETQTHDTVELMAREAEGRLQERVLKRALLRAVEAKDARLTQHVLAAGADPNALVDGPPYDTPMKLALSHDDEDTALVLLRAGARPPQMVDAAKRRMPRLVEGLVEARLDPNGLPGHPETPLSAAAWEGHRPTVEMLLSLGADVNRRNGTSRTPLIEALRGAMGKPDLALVRTLVEAGADVNAESLGDTPLGLAVDACDVESVTLLLARGARWDVPPRRGGGLYERVLRSETCKPVEVLRTVQALREAGIRIREGDAVDWGFLWDQDTGGPEVGEVLRQAGLPPERMP